MELDDRSNRRFNYPFINCTNCGVRYSIIKNLPYDRDQTSMRSFKMCKLCQNEYNDPKDRRYHAQPIGCFKCGPKLSLFASDGKELSTNDPITKAIHYLKEGKILAIKGVGGYHLMCDATNAKVVSKLRERKRRASKPFAVMVKDIKMAKSLTRVNREESELLSSKYRPIVLLKKHSNIDMLCKEVAPNIKQLGLFLPYTPIHYLLLKELNVPLVATSANISSEPLCIEKNEIMRLNSVWDYCLDNNREIVNSCDDSIVFVEGEETFMLRAARGYSPTYLKQQRESKRKVLALGANQKSTVAIAFENSVVLSPHIGDLNSIASVEHFKENILTLKRLYNFEPDVVVCDKHPNYESTKFAIELKEKNPKIELVQIQHHYAHILATVGLVGVKGRVLGVSFDGTGYGDDGNLWGGEFMLCDDSNYERVAHFKYFKLLGGQKAIEEPRRVALSFLFELYGKEVLEMQNETINSFSKQELKMLYISWKKGLNAPLSSSCGRLFDAVASLLDVVQVTSYEGESGLLLESIYDEQIDEYYAFTFENGVIDFSTIFREMLKESNKQRVVSKFFNTLIEIIYEISQKYKLPLVVSGGVFQNRILIRLLKKRIPDAIIPKNFLSNDGAIAYGQVLSLFSKF
ncbi:MAG: carbamoyltransferase HypF [Campylobacterota bacterium]|nr:carbamoyltransferase HypF [Campylobacterota bacterium]